MGLLGNISYSTLERLTYEKDPVSGRHYLITMRPSPHVLLVGKRSLLEHIQATQDPLFWEVRKEGGQYYRRPKRADRRKDIEQAKANQQLNLI